MFDFDELDDVETKAYSSLVLELDEEEDGSSECSSAQAADQCIERLLRQGPPQVARTVAVFGSGMLALPFYGCITGVEAEKRLSFSSHIEAGVLDAIGLKFKFGQCDPQTLLDELAMEAAALEAHMQALSDNRMRHEVANLQEWRHKAVGRIKALEQRAAWALLGMLPGSETNLAQLRRAFKQRTLELHPDKGGDPERFQLLQEMRRCLLTSVGDPDARESKASAATKGRKSTVSCDKHGDGKESPADEKDGQSDGESSEESPRNDTKSADGIEPDFLASTSMSDRSKLAALEGLSRKELEVRRRRLHRLVKDSWERCGKLMEEIVRADLAASTSVAVSTHPPVRALRKLTDKFMKAEGRGQAVARDADEAERSLLIFLDRAAESICYAGMLDPASTLSVVAVQVTMPLLQVCGKAAFATLCASLLDTIKDLPSICESYTSQQQLEKQIAERKRTLESKLPARPHNKSDHQREVVQHPRDDVVAGTLIESRETAEERELPRPTVASKSRSQQLATQRVGTAMSVNVIRSRAALAEWTHPCAGHKLPDGSAIYCAACGAWVYLRERFNPEAFEFHCQQQEHVDRAASRKVNDLLKRAARHEEGDFGWID